MSTYFKFLLKNKVCQAPLAGGVWRLTFQVYFLPEPPGWCVGQDGTGKDVRDRRRKGSIF